MAYRWNFAPVFENADVLWAGALGTLRLFVICVVLGMGFGLVVGLGRHARSRWLYGPATAFVEFFRNTPVLVQILWFYYALPILLPFQIGPLTAPPQWAISCWELGPGRFRADSMMTSKAPSESSS